MSSCNLFLLFLPSLPSSPTPPFLPLLKLFFLLSQALATDEMTAKLIGIFIYHRLTAGGTNPALYQNHVNVCLSNTMEEVYRFQVSLPSPSFSYS